MSKRIYEALCMGDGRLNDLIMLYINKDTPLDYTTEHRYAAKQPRRMLLVNPLQEREEQITDYEICPLFVILNISCIVGIVIN